MKRLSAFVLVILLAALPQIAAAQWTKRYPAVEGFSHQLYLEQEHLPILSSGPVNPAPSPDGTEIAFAHQGWIWLLDLESGVATRITDSPGIDSRPRWSADGSQIALVRDDGADTAIVILRLAEGAELVIDSPAIELDPEFSADGQSLYYTSGQGGSLVLYQRDLLTGEEAIVDGVGRVRRAARSMADGSLLYATSADSADVVRIREADGGNDRILASQGWMAHINADTHPVGRSMVYAVAFGDDLRLAVMDVDRPNLPRWLTPPGRRALYPAFSADGDTVFFVEHDADQQFSLMQVSAVGGEPAPVIITRWDYGSELGELSIAISGADGALAPARISLQTAAGHPVTNPAGPTYVDNQTGAPYFYSDGNLDLALPAGEYRIVATRGPFSIPAEAVFEVHGGETYDLSLQIEEIWSARDAGYVSVDNHVHLNASGVTILELPDMLLPMQGEALDFASPMAWNQYNRFIDADRIGQTASASDGTTIMLSQEVRSDFHGHVGMIGLETAFNPWFFGPRAPVYTDQDLNNGEAIAFAQQRGALPTYVHPIGEHSDPFADLSANPLPYELVLDGVLTPGVGLELVCQWTSPLGTSEVWYRFLNIGRAMPATSGTDMMANFYRAPAMGTARAYVPSGPAGSGFDDMVEQVSEGRGFLTTGPALLFEVADSVPGDVVEAGRQSWALQLTSVRPVERVEIIMNGAVVQTLDGFSGGGSVQYEGEIELPAGGWLAARAVGGDADWPTMAFFHFAHTAPVWIDHVGSTDPDTAKAAAIDLLAALDYSEAEFIEGYGGNVPAGLAARIARTREVLSAMVE